MITRVGYRPEKGVEISPPREGLEKFYWNPSITTHKKKTYVSFRGYEKKVGIWRDYTSPLVVGILKDDTLVEYKLLTPQNGSETVLSNGVEDVRIFSDGKNLMGIGVVLFKSGIERPGRHASAGVRQALLSIDYKNGTYSVVEEYESPKGLPEKNWSPIEGLNYTYHYAIGELWDGELKRVYKPMRDITKVHNGTPLMKFGDEYIGVFHQRCALARRQFRYPNIFIKFDKDFKPIEMSDWWVFEDYKNDEVQFIGGGMSLDDETMALTVGLDRITARTPADYKGLLYKVKLKDIDFKPFDENNLVIRRGELA